MEGNAMKYKKIRKQLWKMRFTKKEIRSIDDRILQSYMDGWTDCINKLCEYFKKNK
jgi:hypothetical protein